MPILQADPALKKVYKGFVLKDMLNTAGEPKIINGVAVNDPKKMLTYISNNRSQLEVLFGKQHVDNLGKMNKIVDEAVFIEPKARGYRTETDVLTGIIRAYLGVFTRPGRFLTSINILRKRAGVNALPELLMDPQRLSQAIQLSKITDTEKVTAETIGRIFFDVKHSPEDLEVASKEDYSKSTISQKNLETLGAEAVFPELTEKALALEYDF